MLTETASCGLGRIAFATFPSTPGGFVCPSPVQKMDTMESRHAGLTAELMAPS